MPVGVFIWTVENLGKEEIEVSIMLTFQNGTGGPSDEAGGHYNEAFMCKGVFSEVRLQDQAIGNKSPEKTLSETKMPTNDSPCQLSPKKAHQNEICVVHDVSGVLLHHAHSQNDYTLAISAKQVTEVSMLYIVYCSTG